MNLKLIIILSVTLGLLLIAGIVTPIVLYYKYYIYNFKKYIQGINSSKDFMWKAQDYNNIKDFTNHLKFITVRNNYEKFEQLVKIVHSIDTKIPKEFNIKEKWNCKSFDYIRDQSNCNSSWAVAAESVFSDRFCIERIKNNKIDNGIFLSSGQLISNCKNCGDGCTGGNPEKSLIFLKYNGLVTGGKFDDKSSCYPYPFPNCLDKKNINNKNCKNKFENPKKREECVNKKYNFNKSRWFVKNIYKIVKEDSIKKELIMNGSILTRIIMKPGFVTYKSGIYNCSKDVEKNFGYQSLKLVGFGEEKDKKGILRKYWLLNNSWNKNWGNNGYIKIDIESDCGILRNSISVNSFYQQN